MMIAAKAAERLNQLYNKAVPLENKSLFLKRGSEITSLNKLSSESCGQAETKTGGERVTRLLSSAIDSRVFVRMILIVLLGVPQCAVYPYSHAETRCWCDVTGGLDARLRHLLCSRTYLHSRRAAVRHAAKANC